MLNVWNETAEIIENCKNMNKKILIHCSAGKSRSASCVIHYLMKKENLSYDDAILYVSKCRPIIEPNNGFKKQLKSI